jgi:hypothetical protein
VKHSENFGESGRLKYRHEREKNEASVDPFLTGKKRKREADRRRGADREKFGATRVVMPRRFPTYPRVRTDVAMHQHRKSVGRAPFSTTVLVVENGRSAGTGGYVGNLPACADFGRRSVGCRATAREKTL